MGNKSFKQKNKQKKDKIENDKIENDKTENDKIENEKTEDIDVTSILSQNRKEELMKFLLSNSKPDEELKKYIDKKIKIKNERLFYPFTSKFKLHLFNFISRDKESLFILISNDVVLVSKESIFDNKELPNFLTFSQIEEDICCDTLHMIIENDFFNNKFSIIKIYDENFNFENHFEIPDNSVDFDSLEKFYYNEKNEEESLGITIDKKEINDVEIVNPLSPIYFKKDNKLFLIGIINEFDDFYIFNKDELIKIKNKMEEFEFKIKLYYNLII